MTSTPDDRLIGAHDLALAALHEITPAATVGPAAGYTVEDGGVVSLRFANAMPGYPDWFWTVSVAVVDDAEPTVLEVELLPGDGALLAPEWVPWAVRLADYQAAQAALAAEGDDDAADASDDEIDDDLDEDLDDLDAADFDEDGSPILHSGDVDGVDIDVLDESADADDEDADDEDSSDDDLDDDADGDAESTDDADDDEDAADASREDD